MKHLFFQAMALLLLLATACSKDENDCPAGFTGDNCDQTALPQYVVVDRVKILQYPQTRTNGQPWDPEQSGVNTLPDLVLNISAVDGSRSVNGGNKLPNHDWSAAPMPFLNFTNILAPELFQFNRSNDGLDKEYRISLSDSDDNYLPPSKELMGAQTFRFYEPGKPFPSKITLPVLTPAGVGFEIYLTATF